MTEDSIEKYIHAREEIQDTARSLRVLAAQLDNDRLLEPAREVAVHSLAELLGELSREALRTDSEVVLWKSEGGTTYRAAQGDLRASWPGQVCRTGFGDYTIGGGQAVLDAERVAAELLNGGMPPCARVRNLLATLRMEKDGAGLYLDLPGRLGEQSWY